MGGIEAPFPPMEYAMTTTETAAKYASIPPRGVVYDIRGVPNGPMICWNHRLG